MITPTVKPVVSPAVKPASKPASAPAVNEVSIDDAVPYMDVKEKMSLMLKGLPGTGKTYTACQFPNPRLFNFDRNTRGLMKLPEEVRKNIKLVDPYTSRSGVAVEPTKVWDNFIDKLARVVAIEEDSTLIFDGLTIMTSMLENMILGTESPKSQFKIQDWGTLARYLANFGEKLVQAKDRDKNLILIAHETPVQDEQDRTVGYKIAIGGQMAGKIESYFTDVWRTFVEKTQSGPIFKICVMPTGQAVAKCSLDLPPIFEFSKLKDKIFAQL